MEALRSRARPTHRYLHHRGLKVDSKTKKQVPKENYNALDQLLSVEGPGGTETLAYNNAGELTTHTRPGNLSRSDARSGTVDAVGTASQSHAFEATAAGPVTASLDWSATSKAYSFTAQPIPASSARSHTVSVSAPGTISATLAWPDLLVNLDLKLYNPAGALVAQASSLTARPETVTYAVAAGATGDYRLEVTNQSVFATTYALSGTYPGLADLNLELRNAAGTTVIAASTANRPEALSFDVPAAGSYSLRVTAASEAASYSLSFTYPVADRRSYSYDARGRPVSEGSNLGSATSALDASGRVIGKTERDWRGVVTSDVRRGFDGGGDSPVLESDAASGAIRASYLADPGGLLAVREGGVTRYQYLSGHGELVQVVDQAGTAAHASPLTYDEFGNTSNGSIPYGYTGQQQRETSFITGTVRMGARLYDPRLGRFLQVDPVEGGCANDYAYVFGDPVNQFDLDGRDVCKNRVLRGTTGYLGYAGLLRSVSALFRGKGNERDLAKNTATAAHSNATAATIASVGKKWGSSALKAIARLSGVASVAATGVDFVCDSRGAPMQMPVGPTPPSSLGYLEWQNRQ